HEARPGVHQGDGELPARARRRRSAGPDRRRAHERRRGERIARARRQRDRVGAGCTRLGPDRRRPVAHDSRLARRRDRADGYCRRTWMDPRPAIARPRGRKPGLAPMPASSSTFALHARGTSRAHEAVRADDPPRALDRRVVFAILAFASGVRLWDAFRTPLAFDEIYALLLARLGPAGIFKVLEKDVDQPLGFLVTWAWRALGGEGELWLKLPSIAFGVA